MVNQTFHVLNKSLKSIPDWVVGQLYIGGIGVAMGYWGDKEKTENSFIIHPKTGERLYKTGDLGRYMPDGNIEFLGREDFQVKIQGYRIELGEIESILLKHSKIKNCIVNASGSKKGNKRLIAYIVPDNKKTEEVINESTQDLGIANESNLNDPLERFKFKLSHTGLRKDIIGKKSIDLVKPEIDNIKLDKLAARRSYRKFSSEKISFEQFSNFISSMMEISYGDKNNNSLKKYQYGSAGGLYPVQIYIYIKNNMVENVDAGIYYYQPQTHKLVNIAENVLIDQNLYAGTNKSMYDMSGFAIFLIGKLGAIKPLYGEWSRDFCLIESGLISQVLEEKAYKHNIGLCQVGGFNFEIIEKLFNLDNDHIYLHQLVGGRIESSSIGVNSLIDEASEFTYLTQLIKSQDSNEHYFQKETGKKDELINDIKNFLTNKLPDYMIPSSFILLDDLPLNSNGKVDRSALANIPDDNFTESKKVFTVPQTEIEEMIAKIWQEILNVDKISIHDSIFDLGGNSLHVIQIHNKIESTLNIKIPIIKIFEYSTIYSFTQFLTEDKTEDSMVGKSSERAEARREHRNRRENKKGNRG